MVVWRLLEQAQLDHSVPPDLAHTGWCRKPAGAQRDRAGRWCRKGPFMWKKTPAKSGELSLTSVPAFWPMAMAASLWEQGAQLVAKNLRFVEEEIKIQVDQRHIRDHIDLYDQIDDPV
jgi:hypothetical protein